MTRCLTACASGPGTTSASPSAHARPPRCSCRSHRRWRWFWRWRLCAAAQDAPFQILDNSFLVEEAFNQEPGIFQNVLTARRDEDDEWQVTFTQEWPLFTQTHQLSFTAAVQGVSGASGFGDLYINYRWQALAETETVPAFSPRLSLILGTGNASQGLGAGGNGWQVNLPVSKQFGDAYLHWNAGFTHNPNAESGDREYNLFTPHVAMSGIWRLRPMFNLMLESVVEFEQFVESDATRREAVFTLSPGFRTGWGTAVPQTIVGVAIPIRMTDGRSSAGVFGYSLVRAGVHSPAAVKRSTMAASSTGSARNPFLSVQLIQRERFVPEAVHGETASGSSIPGGFVIDPRVAHEHRVVRGRSGPFHQRQQGGRIRLARAKDHPRR